MKRDLIPIYDGKLKANRIASITRGGVTFDIIRPGYDSQGRRRQSWTQFVYEGIPVHEIKLQVDLSVAFAKFDADWEKYIAADPEILIPALKASMKERRAKFMDGRSEQEPAPAVTVDGRESSKNYVS